MDNYSGAEAWVDVGRFRCKGTHSQPMLVRPGKTSCRKWPWTMLARHRKEKEYPKQRGSMCKSIEVSKHEAF